jgi:hypothetical protein
MPLRSPHGWLLWVDPRPCTHLCLMYRRCGVQEQALPAEDGAASASAEQAATHQAEVQQAFTHAKVWGWAAAPGRVRQRRSGSHAGLMRTMQGELDWLIYTLDRLGEGVVLAVSRCERSQEQKVADATASKCLQAGVGHCLVAA